jgi:DIX domain
MLVQYFIQNDSREPFAFTVKPQAQELTIGDIKKSFPVPGSYYFRFKTVLQDEVPAATVWLDDLDDQAPVPTYKDQVIFKALQIPPFDTLTLQKPSKKVYQDPKPVSTPIIPRKQSDLLISDDFNFTKHNDRSHSAAPFPFLEPKSNSLDMKKKIDPTDGLTTEQLKKRAEDKIKQQVNQKTEEVKKLWEDEANLRKEKKDADKEFNEKISNWETKNHQKNNIRALLATLHNVLWADSGWEAISPGDLITPAQVKSAYLKSLNIIHPDKHQNDAPHIRYISERVFSAVNEAFKLFRSNS